MAKHSVALIDDHHLMRSGLVNMINGMGDYEVVQEFANGKEFVDALRTTTAPAIAIVDLNMPVMDGYETITWLTPHAPTRVVDAGRLPFGPGDEIRHRPHRNLRSDDQHEAVGREIRRPAASS